MKEITLIDLLEEIKLALLEEDKAERARVNAEFKKTKAHYNRIRLMDALRNKEFVI